MNCDRRSDGRVKEQGVSMITEPNLCLVGSESPNKPGADVLLLRVARGDVRAFEQLYDSHSASVYRMARRILLDPNRAEDVTQDVFIEVWCKAPNFDPSRGSAKTWLMAIAHRRAVDAVRRNELQKRSEAKAAPDSVCYDEPADQLLKEEEHAVVRRCLGSLTGLQLESVRLAYFNGYTHAEVATLLGKPVPTIKTRIRDGLIRLRRSFEET